MPHPSLSVGAYGEGVARLHDHLARQGYQPPASEVARRFFGPGTRAVLLTYQMRHGISRCGELDAATAALLENEGSPSTAPAFPPVRGEGVAKTEGGQDRVEGRIYCEHGMPAATVPLRLYARGLGADTARLGETRTDPDGFYSLTYHPGTGATTIEIRALDSEGNEIPLTAMMFDAKQREMLNLVAPACEAQQYGAICHCADRQVPSTQEASGLPSSFHVENATETPTVIPRTEVGTNLYERLGGVFAIAAVIDHFSDAIVQNPIVGRHSANPVLREWHTNNLGRLPGLKFMRTLWVCDVAGGPIHFSATRPGHTDLGLEKSHRHLRISPEEFDAAAAELAHTLDAFNIPEPEKQEVLRAFAAHKEEVTDGYTARARSFT